MNPQSKKIFFKKSCFDLSDQDLDVDALVVEISRISSITPLTLLDISNNIKSEESCSPNKMDKLFLEIERLLKENKNITSLLVAGNSLFSRTPHPANQHLRDYLVDLNEILLSSTVTEVDISDNVVIGFSGQQMSGLAALCRQFLLKKGTSFTCRLNRLHSSSLLFISESLGCFSSLVYLDLSDNYICRDSSGSINLQGIRELSSRISQTMKLKTLNLARNELCDDSFVYIFEAVATMLHIQTVDVSGNCCHEMGTEAVKSAIISHSLNFGSRLCLKDLNISSNPLGPEGSKPLFEAISKSETLMTLNLSDCLIDKRTNILLQSALVSNTHLTKLVLQSNIITPIMEAKTQAEIEANNLLHLLSKNVHAVDASNLSSAVYSALERKLKSLSKEVLMKLHANMSFMEPETKMMETLIYLQPPSRHAMFGAIDGKLASRLEHSQTVFQRVDAAWVIHRFILSWYTDFKIHGIRLREKVIGLRTMIMASKIKSPKKGRK